MYLAVLAFQSEVSIVEGEGGVDDHDVVRHGRQVVFLLQYIEGPCVNRSTGVGVEERVDDERRAATVVNTNCRRPLVMGYAVARTVIHEDTVGEREFGQHRLHAVYQCRIGMQRLGEVRRINAVMPLVAALPTIIDSRATFLGHQTSLVVITAYIGRRILRRIGVDKRQAVKHDRDHDAVARGVFALPVRLYHLSGHIFDNKELVALRGRTGIGHLDDGRVRLRVTRRILDVKAVSAEEGKAIHSVVIVRLGTIRQQRLQRIGGDDERTAVIDHITRRERTSLVVAQETDILVMVVMGRHQPVDSRLEVGSRCLPCQTILADRVFGLGSHPHRIDLLTLDIQLNILVLVDTYVNIDIGLTGFRVFGDTIHVAGYLFIAGCTGVRHVILVLDRQRGADIRHIGAVSLGVPVIDGSERMLYIIKGSDRQTADREYAPRGTGIGAQRGVRSRKSCFECIELLFARIAGEEVSYTTGDGLLEVPPALIGRQVHTGEQPVGVLHVTIDTGDEGRLFEVRTVGCGIDRVDQRVVISVNVGKETIVYLHREIMHYLCTNRFLSRINEITLFVSRQEVSLRRRLHTGRTIGLTIGAEIESLHQVTLRTEFG